MKIISHEEHLGLKKHILSCGDLTQTYESIIMLEDDLVVAPYFYQYAVDALAFYASSNNIAGISLYSHLYNESAGLPFIPLHDGSDVYFLQTAPSSGQLWTKNMWIKFRNWYNEGQTIDYRDNLPDNVISWKDTSWKKYFIKYAVQNNMYFVYPRVSYTTNFGEVGTHTNTQNTLHQVPLSLSPRAPYFQYLNESYAIYDAYCELLPSIYKKLNPELVPYDFISDLYGVKRLFNIQSPYILTSKEIKPKTAIKSFALEMKPMELNIKYNIVGDLISLVDTQHTGMGNHLSPKLKTYEYFYSTINKYHCFFYLQKKLKKILKQR